MKMVLVAGSAAVGKTTVIKRIIEQFREKKTICYFKMDVCSASEDIAINQEYNINTAKYYSGELCPDHAEISVLPDVFEWAKKCNADLLIIESAGLCLRCSPFLTQGVNLAIISLTSGIDSIDKMRPLIHFAETIILTRMDLVSQAEREVYSEKLFQKFEDKRIIATNALQGISINKIVELIEKSEDIELEKVQLKGLPPLGTCTICMGKKELGWNKHYGVVRKISNKVSKTVYKGD